MRSIITIILGILLVAFSVFVAKNIIENKKKPKPREQKLVTTVFTQTVKNTDSPITISSSGQLTAKNKIELFSEVQGVFEYSAREFKPGVYFRKGETLLRLNSSEHFANLQALKSSLYNQIIAILPDLRLDYPEAFPQWEAYVREFDMEKLVKPLPEPTSEKEKLFVSGKNVFTTYYNVKNLQVRLGKYNIAAPFHGILTDALVNPGTLVRQGQKLGELIDPSVYELEVAINVAYMNQLKVGESVLLSNIEHTKSWTGKVIRINGKVDNTTQTIKTYIEVRGKDLKEGMFLEAEVEAKKEQNTFEVARKLLIEDKKVFVLRDSFLELKEVFPVYFKEETAVVKGLEDGTVILSKNVPGAYDGMLVKQFEEAKGQ